MYSYIQIKKLEVIQFFERRIKKKTRCAQKRETSRKLIGLRGLKAHITKRYYHRHYTEDYYRGLLRGVLRQYTEVYYRQNIIFYWSSNFMEPWGPGIPRKHAIHAMSFLWHEYFLSLLLVIMLITTIKVCSVEEASIVLFDFLYGVVENNQLILF